MSVMSLNAMHTSSVRTHARLEPGWETLTRLTTLTDHTLRHQPWSQKGEDPPPWLGQMPTHRTRTPVECRPVAATDCRNGGLAKVELKYAGIRRDVVGGPQIPGARWTEIRSSRAKSGQLAQPWGQHQSARPLGAATFLAATTVPTSAFQIGLFPRPRDRSAKSMRYACHPAFVSGPRANCDFWAAVRAGHRPFHRGHQRFSTWIAAFKQTVVVSDRR